MAEANPPVDSSGRFSPSRREFVKTLGMATLAASVSPIDRPRTTAAPTSAGPDPSSPAETAVARFYHQLKDDQRKLLCFPFDHPKRSQVSNNWAIVKPTIGDLSGEQQALCREIFKGLCSEEGFDRFQRQMKDDYGGFENYHVAVFGEPGTGRPFEWVLTGRHCTLRADGNRREGIAFGGPIFYGHAAAGHSGLAPGHATNVWAYQARRANEIFATFDEDQRRLALGSGCEPDDPHSTRLRGADLGANGLSFSTLDEPQKQIVRQLLRDLTCSFRAFDVEEVQECLREVGDTDTPRLTFFRGPIGNDQVRDIWKLEGSSFVWYFHGSPHVHSWVNVDRNARRVVQNEGGYNTGRTA